MTEGRTLLDSNEFIHQIQCSHKIILHLSELNNIICPLVLFLFLSSIGEKKEALYSRWNNPGIACRTAEISTLERRTMRVESAVFNCFVNNHYLQVDRDIY